MRPLDSQLNLRNRHPNFQTFLDINESESQRVRTQYLCYLDQKYGDDPLQSLDIFPSEVSHSPILIFIHGGYWRALDKSSYSFVAEPFVKQNMTVFVINYRLIPGVRMEQVLDDVQQALQWIQQSADQYNGDPNRMVISGHSAGGHLALMTYLRDEELRSKVNAICSLSGIFDLAPIQQSYLNEVLQLKEEEVAAFSVAHKDLSVITCPTLLSVGSGETELFLQQSRDLYLQNKDMTPISYYAYPQLNHYEIVHQLGRVDSPLVRFILKNEKG